MLATANNLQINDDMDEKKQKQKKTKQKKKQQQQQQKNKKQIKIKNNNKKKKHFTKDNLPYDLKDNIANVHTIIII